MSIDGAGARPLEVRLPSSGELLADVYEGDTFALLAGLPDSTVDMVFADPPYNLSNGGYTVSSGRRVAVHKGDWDASEGAENDFDFHLRWLRECRRVLKPNGTLWVSGTYHSIYACGYAMQLLDYHILNDVVWYKPNAAPNLACRMFTASHETLIWARKDVKGSHTFHYDDMKNAEWVGDPLKADGKQMRTIWQIPTSSPKEKTHGRHPTQKPVALLNRIVRASTNPGDLVVDPFTGSGTTGVVAAALGRSFIGVDMNAEYVDLARRRIETALKNRKFAEPVAVDSFGPEVFVRSELEMDPLF